MLKNLNRLFLSFILILFTICVYGTHNRAGEITYEQIGELTIRATITTYTKTSSEGADRDTLELFWGDGTSEFVWRTNGNGFPLPNDIKVNYYTAEHTYPGRGTYTLSMTDPNRVASILNINPPNSVLIPFYIQTQFTLLNTQFQGLNNSAILLQAPIDFACVGERFIHNPNAYDIDGDSLSFELITPFQERNVEVPLYSPVDQKPPGPNNRAFIDSETGTFVWDAPQLQGEYNIAIKINEYREGVFINSIIRDMQIFVIACENKPPEIETIEEICVIAGEKVEFDVIVTDPDSNQLVALSATGAPFLAEASSANLSNSDTFQSPPLNARFSWQTDCNDISASAYQIVFRAVDNFFDTTGLATLKSVNIRVVGPAPENLIAETNEGAIKLSWDSPYACEVTEQEYFQGFSVWRKINSLQFPLDSCQGGLEGLGYEKIIFLTEEKEGERYVAIDNTVENGPTYCYRVVAEFALTTPTGNPFNKVQSLPSNESCIVLSRDYPFITNVSVLETSADRGSIEIAWTKPVASELDTVENPGPYQYQLQRSEGIGTDNFQDIPGAIFQSQSFSGLNANSYLDENLNTLELPYTYRVLFYSGQLNTPLSSSDIASSIFLLTDPQDQALNLSWAEQVPWQNIKYDIFLLNQASGTFDSIGSSDVNSFVHQGLVNGNEYCYKITSSGSYNIDGVPEPLINDSQISCNLPEDLTPPCAPELVVQSACDQVGTAIPFDELENNLFWGFNGPDCNESDDLAGYNVYYAETEDSPLELISELDTITEFTHKPSSGIAGCYAVTSIDLLGNESEMSNKICLVNCPSYELPNVFTPNNDSVHDTFKPRNNRFIESINLKIYNRWGQLVFETIDPDINWDGTNQKGKELADGVYYYTCEVIEAGPTQLSQILKGNIHILRSR